MSETCELLIIDPQVDFCDPQRGALYVPGAEKDMRRLASMIRRLADHIDAVHVTLDSHHFIHIAHPIFWRGVDGQHPPAFTRISRDEVERGVWRAARPSSQDRALAYVRQLEQNGRYELVIWPPHCLIGSPGHAVFPELFDALRVWEERRFTAVNFIPKGGSLLTEHYSAIRADVPDEADPATQPNTELLGKLAQAGLIAVAGEARTHCVANTVRDIAEPAGDSSLISKVILLSDASSDISGFETHAACFINDMSARGMRLSTTTDFSPDQFKESRG